MVITYKMRDASGGAMTGLTPTTTINGVAALGTTAEVGSGYYSYTTHATETATTVVLRASAALAVTAEVVAAAPAMITADAIADEVQTRTIARVTLVDTTTTNTDMRGTDSANTVIPDNASAVAAAASAASADGKLTAGRVGKLDSLTFTTPGKVDSTATVAGVPTVEEIDTELTLNHGIGLWGASIVTPPGYTRVTSATYGTLRAGSVIDAYAPADTTYSTPLVDNAVAASNGSWAIDLPDAGTYVLVARLAGYEDVTQAGVTT